MNDAVLVIEDNALLAKDIEELLRQQGCEVVCCSGAQDVEQALTSRSFDLALVDVALQGGESGLDLVPRLQRHNAFCEVVLMTGNASLRSALRAMHSGIYAYLPKPFPGHELVAVVKRALGQVALKRERQALSERLVVSEAMYRGVVETVEACIVGLDAQGSVRFANRSAAERLGASGSLEGRSLLDFSNARGARELARALAKVVGGDTVRDLEIRHEQPGRTQTMRWTLTRLQPEHVDGAPRASARDAELPHAVILAVGIDITDRLELERRGAESRAMAAMGTLTTGLAHEIRNPLNAAKLQLELLTRRAKRSSDARFQSELAEPAELVRSELDRVSTLLDNFLELARPRVPVRRSFAVAELFEAVRALREPLAGAAGITMHMHLAEPELTTRCDPDKLKQVLINLVRNSIDAMAERGFGEVHLHAERGAEGGVIIAVLDDGPGLAPEMQGDVAFEPFTTTKPAGSGLGLSIVKNIVAQHDGTIELANRPEGGSAVRFSISD
jgi:signal transduction histidine kinase